MKINYMSGNIADMHADAIVLPANSHLKEGSGSSKAIFERAGRKKLKQDCEKCIAENGPLSIGDVVVARAYNLDADCILHAVVPRWIDGKSDEYVDLMMTYMNALTHADAIGCKSIAFPLLASGNNGFDTDLALKIAQEAVEAFEAHSLDKVYLVLFGHRIVNMLTKEGILVSEVKKREKQRSKDGSGFTAENVLNLVGAVSDLVVKVIEIDQRNPEIRKFASVVVSSLMGTSSGGRKRKW